MWITANNSEIDSQIVRAKVGSARYLAVDCETNGEVWYRGYMGVVSIAWGEERDCCAATRNVQEACDFIRESTGRLIFHNVGFDNHFVGQYLPFPWDRTDCTLIMSRLLDNLAENHRLKDECTRFFGIDPEEQSNLKAWLDEHKTRNFLEAPDYILLPYAAQDTALTLRLYNLFWPQIQAHLPVYQREMQIRSLLSQAETRGVKIDIPLLFDKLHTLQAELAKIDSAIFEAVGHEFNVNSDQQLGLVLHNEIGLPVIAETEKTKRPKVDDYCLIQMNHPAAEMTRRHNKIVKSMGYLDSYLDLVDSTDHLHPNINTLQAVTSRMSSSEPNIQQVPIHDDEWNIRELFTSEEGWFFEVDYDKQELRLAGEIAPDRELLVAIKQGRDVYTEMAAAGFGTDVVSPELRQATKVMVLARCYGAGAAKLAYTATVQTAQPYTYDQASEFRRRFDRAYRGLATGFRQASDEAKRDGEIITGFDRRLFVNPQYSYKGFNAKIQGTAKDETLLGCLAAQPLLQSVGARIIAPVHDSVWGWSPERPSQGFCRRLAAAMDSHKFSIPATVHIKVGRTWGTMEAVYGG